jgi:hypothetical protein
LRRVATAEHLAVQTMPEGVRQRDAAGTRFVFNYNPAPVEFDGEFLPAAGVTWHAI